VGFKVSWIGFDGKGKTSALEKVGLQDTGEPDRANEALFSGAEIPGGWFILFSNNFEFVSRERLAQLSVDCSTPDRAKVQPDGQITRRAEFLSSPPRKNIPLCRYPKSNLQASLSHPRHEGRIAIVTDVGMGCGGRGLHHARESESQGGLIARERSQCARRVMRPRTAKSCGPGIRC
jgi:hypothetical protein